MKRRILKRIRHKTGRNPRGYGLSSLVVVLFLVAALVQTIVTAMARDLTEAQANAAFNIAKEHLDIFQITRSAPEVGNTPHIPNATRFMTSTYSGDVENRFVAFSYIGSDPRAEVLFEQKLRAYTNTPNTETLGPFSPEDIRREYPERILLVGDRMSTRLLTENILGANSITMGTISVTSDMDIESEITGITGDVSTVINVSRLVINGNTTTDSLAISDRLTSDSFDISLSLKSGPEIDPEIDSEFNVTMDVTVNGFVTGQDATIEEIFQSGQFLPGNGLDDVQDLEFTNELNVIGLRVENLCGETLQVSDDNIEGGSRQEIEDAPLACLPPDDIPADSPPDGVIFGSDGGDRSGSPALLDVTPVDTTYDQCVAAGGNAYSCL